MDDDKEPVRKPASDEITVYQKAYNELLKENDRLREDMEIKIEEARVQKVMLTQERKQRKVIMTEQTNYYARRNQLEELFLECVEEVRKDISRRKATTIGLHGDLATDLKKPLKAHFTATDKRKVLDLLLANENVLLFLYEKLFPRPVASQSFEAPEGTKIASLDDDVPSVAKSTRHAY